MNLDGDGAKACRSDGEDSTEAEAVEVGDVKGEDWEKPTFSLMSLSNEAHFIVFPEDRNMWLSSEPPKQKLKNPRSELPSKITNDRNLNLRNPRSQTDRPLQMQVSIEKTQRQRPRSDFYFTERRREKERGVWQKEERSGFWMAFLCFRAISFNAGDTSVEPKRDDTWRHVMGSWSGDHWFWVLSRLRWRSDVTDCVSFRFSVFSCMVFGFADMLWASSLSLFFFIFNKGKCLS